MAGGWGPVTAHPTVPATPAIPVPPVAAPAAPARVGGRDWIDVAIEWASGLAAVGMFAYGVCLSYSVLHAIAAAASLPAWAAAVWPLGFEAFMASAALNALAEQRHRRGHPDRWRRVPWYPWTLTALTAGASIGLNWFHPAIPLAPPPGWLVSVVYGLPPLIAVLAWHLFLGRVAHRRQHPTPPTTVPAVPAGPGTVPEDQDGTQDRDRGPGPAGQDGPAPDTPAGDPATPVLPGPAPRTARPAVPAGPSRPAADPPDGGRLTRARAAAAEFQAAQGRPIGRDALRRALRVSNQTASDLLRALRAPTPGPAPGPHRDGDGDRARTVGAGAPAPPDLDDPAGGTVPVNGHAGQPVALAALVPGGPAGQDEDGGGVAGDA